MSCFRSDPDDHAADGSWLYHQVQEDDTSSGGGLDDDDDEDEDDESSVQASPICLPCEPINIDLSLFDPFVAKSGKTLDSIVLSDQLDGGLSNEWLLSMVVSTPPGKMTPIQGVELEDLVNFDHRRVSEVSTSSTYAAELADILEGRCEEVTTPTEAPVRPAGQRSGSFVESGKGDLTESPFSSHAKQARCKVSGTATSGQRKESFGLECQNCEYIMDASKLIGQALEFESIGDYSMAFAQYKCAIAILLKGVQSEAPPCIHFYFSISL